MVLMMNTDNKKNLNEDINEDLQILYRSESTRRIVNSIENIICDLNEIKKDLSELQSLK
jgi:hypothetical protein